MDGSPRLARIGLPVLLGAGLSVFLVGLLMGLAGPPEPLLAAAIGATATGLVFAFSERRAPQPPDIARELQRRLDSVEVRWRASMRVRDAFLARMSHELRTPLNAIVGYAELLSEDLDGDAAQDVEHIRSAAVHLLALVTTLLDLTQLQSQSYVMQPELVDVGAIARSVVEAVRSEADGRGNTVKVELDGNLTATLDRRMIQSIALHLVSSACRTTANGTVTVRAVRTMRWIELSVTDTGIGLTPRQIEAAFRLFDPSGSESARYDGIGLGLAVVRQFAEAMGGEASVENVAGAGARILVQLPLDGRAVTPRSASLFDDQPTTLGR